MLDSRSLNIQIGIVKLIIERLSRGNKKMSLLKLSISN